MSDFIVINGEDVELTKDSLWLVREHLRAVIDQSETQEKYLDTLTTINRLTTLLRKLGDGGP